MLPGLGFSEIAVIALIALVVVGPKDLPLLLRKMGKAVNRMRAMADDFRSSMDEIARQAELDELKKEVESLRRTVSSPLGVPADYGMGPETWSPPTPPASQTSGDVVTGGAETAIPAPATDLPVPMKPLEVPGPAELRPVP
jgi:sec-independent protein translocase protein TatB